MIASAEASVLYDAIYDTSRHGGGAHVPGEDGQHTDNFYTKTELFLFLRELVPHYLQNQSALGASRKPSHLK
jgi:hypothetical protein